MFSPHKFLTRNRTEHYRKLGQKFFNWSKPSCSVDADVGSIEPWHLKNRNFYKLRIYRLIASGHQKRTTFDFNQFRFCNAVDSWTCIWKFRMSCERVERSRHFNERKARHAGGGLHGEFTRNAHIHRLVEWKLLVHVRKSIRMRRLTVPNDLNFHESHGLHIMLFGKVFNVIGKWAFLWLEKQRRMRWHSPCHRTKFSFFISNTFFTNLDGNFTNRFVLGASKGPLNYQWKENKSTLIFL